MNAPWLAPWRTSEPIFAQNAVLALPLTVIPHGDTEIVSVQTDVNFRALRLVVDPICAPFYFIDAMVFAFNHMMNEPIAASCFPPLPPDFATLSEEDRNTIKSYLNKITFPTIVPEQQIRVYVRHRAMCPWHTDCNGVPGMMGCEAPPFSAFFQGVSQTQ